MKPEIPGHFLSLAVAALLLSGCGSNHWVEFNPKDGGFTVSLPAEPSRRETVKDTPLGQVTLHAYMITTNEITFAVHYSDYAKGMTEGKTADEMLDPGVRQLFFQYPRAREHSEKVLLQGFQARQFTIDDPDTEYSTRGQSCLVGDRIYVVLAVMPTRLATRPEVKRFLDSFRLDAERLNKTDR